MTLRLVTPDDALTHEYLPLPHYPWDERPLTVPIDQEEAATAIHLAAGNLIAAASLLRAAPVRLRRLVTAHPRLQRIQREHLELLNDRAINEVASAFDSPDDRRREWATARVLQSRLAQSSNPLAPAPASTASSHASLSLDGAGKFVFRWRTDADDAAPSPYQPDGHVIDHDPDPG